MILYHILRAGPARDIEQCFDFAFELGIALLVRLEDYRVLFPATNVLDSSSRDNDLQFSESLDAPRATGEHSRH